MTPNQARRRRSPIAAGLAVLALTLGFTVVPAAAAPAPPLSYIALGDSYTAGTGSGESSRPDAACWRSSPGYVDDVAATGRVNLVANVACHGTVLSTSSPYYDGVTPTVEEQLYWLIGQRQFGPSPRIVSITAGAIDAGSLQVLGACATQDTQQCGAAVNAVAANLPVLREALANFYLFLHANSRAVKIAVMGYPRLFDPVNGTPVILPDNQRLVNQAVDALNATIAAAVGDENARTRSTTVEFVDVTKRFQNHAANSLDPWVVLNPLNPFEDANFHPNPTGYLEGYTPALLSKIKPAQLVQR